jgi:cobalamin biosynthesis protein CbiG
MDKKIAGLLGAAAALTTMTAAQAVAEPTPSTPSQSYRDLLEPVPNALAALKADDARLSQEWEANQQLAFRLFLYHHHHHHHHHHGYYGYYGYRRGYYHHHHHHHHHHHGFGIYIR